ncbi:hypothetical protein [Sodalis sp.]|uniref:hypothetical protein n=1 Tax=Sodalis sp. (in: enterobacteria) TaxID=1898979 RepID=UPI00387303E9
MPIADKTNILPYCHNIAAAIHHVAALQILIALKFQAQKLIRRDKLLQQLPLFTLNASGLGIQRFQMVEEGQTAQP